MSLTFDPYKLRSGDVSRTEDVLMTNPTATSEMERYWGSLPRTRGVPMSKDVDPAKMEGLLEDSFILERVAPGVARIRVAGRILPAFLGWNPVGCPYGRVPTRGACTNGAAFGKGFFYPWPG